MKCTEKVTEGKKSRDCKLKANYRLTRRSDGDVFEVCGIHRRQLQSRDGGRLYRVELL